MELSSDFWISFSEEINNFLLFIAESNFPQEALLYIL
jgi:hypothetical protein